jgi:hypothetical protein
LQVASGQVVKNVDTSLDWMYEGPAAQSEQSTEEYLLGKIFKPKDNSTNQLKEIGKEMNVSLNNPSHLLLPFLF